MNTRFNMRLRRCFRNNNPTVIKNEQYGITLLLHGGVNNKGYQNQHCQEKGGADKNMQQHFVLMDSQQANTHTFHI